MTMTKEEQLVECDRLIAESETDIMKKFWTKTKEEINNNER